MISLIVVPYVLLILWAITKHIEEIIRLCKLPRPWLHIPCTFVPIVGRSLSDVLRSAENV